MIVDDERALRNLLKLAIDWEGIGLEVAGEAASGIEAVNIMDEVKPDIILVDIRMPFMDGIDFSKQVMKQHPDMKIIVLTAFDDFEYARKCVGIGVSEYILKPIDRSEITEALKRVAGQLDERGPKKEPDDCEEMPVGAMDKIKQHVQDNYSSPEITLTSVAQLFGFNSSYLSRRFKADAGISFIDYLTRCRMDKAVEYAHKRVMMYIAAKQVGISDPNYFSKCFKKYTGKSYSEMLKEDRD
jgi:YesN/AraC family two-component response regulator